MKTNPISGVKGVFLLNFFTTQYPILQKCHKIDMCKNP